MANPLVSVIIPVYKVERYLRRCLDSVVGQTYDNLEIILVDDGSPDGCPAICDEYATKDSRIIVVHKGNGGAASARNTGLDRAKGEYIAFVDADDCVADVYIEALWKTLTRHQAEMAVCSYLKTTLPYSLRISDFSCEECEVMDSRQAIACLLYPPEHVKWVTPWGKLAKASLFDGIRFPEVTAFEDEYTAHKILYRSGKIAALDLPLYCYCQRGDSIMGVIKPYAIRDLRARVERYLFFKEHHEGKLAKLCFNGICWQLLLAYARGKAGKTPQGFSDADEIIRLFRICQKDHWTSQAAFSQRLRLRVFAACPALYLPYRRMLDAIKWHGGRQVDFLNRW